jgi:hypothetical protein
LERLDKAKKEVEAQVVVMSAQAVQDAARIDHLASHSNVMSAQAVQDAARIDHLASHSNVMSAQAISQHSPARPMGVVLVKHGDVWITRSSYLWRIHCLPYYMSPGPLMCRKEFISSRIYG